MNMTTSTSEAERLFERIERQSYGYFPDSFPDSKYRPYYIIGALKGNIEHLAYKFPEVAEYIKALNESHERKQND